MLQTSLPVPEPEPVPEFPFPFFVKTRKHGALGPLNYDQMLNACNPKTYGGLEISGTGDRWMPVPTFATLAGLEYLAPQKVAFTNVVMVQRLEERSLVHILARLGLTRKTGRLILMESGSGLDVARREIDLLQGAPTFVYTDRPELQLPELLARRELVGDEQLPELLHAVLQSERTLLDIVAERTSQDVRRQLTFLMRDRMAELFTWRVGKVAFDEGTQPRSNQPFAPSTLRLLFGCVQRGWSSGELEAELQPYREVPLQVSDRFEDLIHELGLDPSQEAAARRFTSGSTISSVVQQNASEVMTHLLIAYLLLEMKLIFPTGE